MFNISFELVSVILTVLAIAIIPFIKSQIKMQRDIDALNHKYNLLLDLFKEIREYFYKNKKKS